MPATAQIIPNAPVINFRLPMFNPQGFKTWELRGDEGRYIDDNHVEIIGVDLKIFAGDETGALQTSITSPLAVVLINDRVIEGPGVLHVEGPGYRLSGEDWTYRDESKSIVINRDVVVTFDASVGSVLK